MSYRVDKWKIETVPDCARWQTEMIANLRREGFPNAIIRDLARCSDRFCSMEICVEGCHFGTFLRRGSAVDSGLPLLQNHPGPHYAVSIVHPLWEASLGGLHELSLAAAKQWISRRLSTPSRQRLRAIGAFEVSLNINLDRESHWAGEVQLIVCGAEREQLSELFRIGKRYRELRPRQRMVQVSDVGDLERQFMYSQKRFVERRIAYVSTSTGTQDRRHLPLRPDEQAEHDAWLLSIPLGDRAICFGISRRGKTFYVPDHKSIGDSDEN